MSEKVKILNINRDITRHHREPELPYFKKKEKRTRRQTTLYIELR